MFRLIFSVILCFATSVYASDPIVCNVTASQRPDKIVEIHYDLEAATSCAVIVQVSDDAGTTWNVPVTALTGAVGAGVISGTDKVIEWACMVDLKGVGGTKFKVRICATASETQIPVGMVLVPAGEYQMGDAAFEGDSPERPVHAVYVDAFFMDAYSVTNQQYVEGLNWALGQGLVVVTSGVVYQSGTGTKYPYCNTSTASNYSRISWNGTLFSVISGRENHPVTEISWYGSVAYANWRSGMQGKPLCYDLSTWTCNWGDGYRLPTEAEWERAARGGTVGRRFPWTATDNITQAYANYYSTKSPFYDVNATAGYHPTFNHGTMPYTNPVGFFAANSYGLYDMSGNVWNWCNDWYGGVYYSGSPINNPLGSAIGTNRVLRGGSWGSNAAVLRCAYRGNALPSYRAVTNGCRLVMPAH